MTAGPLAAAFDHAIAQVDRALAAGMQTAGGEPATPELARLRTALVAERERAVARGRVDREWVRETVRGVAAWTPESELSLLAALGGIARADTKSGPGADSVPSSFPDPVPDSGPDAG